MAERDRSLKETPGGIVASNAFKYAIKFFKYAEPKYPEMRKQPIENRLAAFQAAIVVAALIQQERLSLDGAKALRESVSRGFPPSARHRCLTAVQHLSAYMLKVERESIGRDEIPALTMLAAADDNKLKDTFAVWLGGSVMDRWTLGEADKPAAAAMSRSAWTSAIMIGRMLKK